MVPKGWSHTTFEKHIDCLTGYAFSSTEYSAEEHDIRLLRGDNIEPGKLRWINAKRWPRNVQENMDKYFLLEGDFVIALDRTWISGGLKVAEVTCDDLPCLLVQRVARIRAKKTLAQGLLRQYFSGYKFEQYVKLTQTATAVPHISPNDIKQFSLLLPPIAEQKKIAQILSTWDKAISVTEKLLTNSQQQKKALMQQLLTGKKRLLDENGVRFNGKWEKKLLSDVADVYQPKTISQSMMSDSGYPVYGANGVIGFYQEFNHETEQIAVTCRGSTCGIVNWTQAKSWITGNAMVINTDNYSYVSKKFLFYTLNGSDLKYLISGSGQPQITGNIKTHIINLPCIEEQQKIATVLSAADAEIYTLEKKLACLRDEKKALMQQLLTGKRRVKVDEAVAV